jgi:hypothetical protein
MPNAARQAVASPEGHVVTVQEALEPLFLALEQEAEVKMLSAALNAGWPLDEALTAIDELRRNDLLPILRPH